MINFKDKDMLNFYVVGLCNKLESSKEIKEHMKFVRDMEPAENWKYKDAIDHAIIALDYISSTYENQKKYLLKMLEETPH